jgi:nucleoside-diphosphate-sugar epimerase
MGALYIVTGDRGFVGSRLRRRLLANGLQVIGLDVRPAPQNPEPRYQPLVIDLTDRAAVRERAAILRSARGIFHLAAKLPVRDDEPLAPHLAANLRTTENLLEALDGAGVPLVLSSTMSVYGLPPRSLPVGEDQIPSPVEAYGLSKIAAECAAERMARAGRIPCVVLRYSGIFGAGYNYGAIHLYTSKALAGEPVSVYGGGRVIRDYVSVNDVVAANILAVDAAPGRGWGLYHIGGGMPLPLVEVARLVVEAVGRGTVETNDQPAPFDFAFDISRARRDLNHNPLPLRVRIAESVEEIKETVGSFGVQRPETHSKAAL